LICCAGALIGVLLGFLSSLLFDKVPMIGNYLSFKPDLELVVPTVAATIALGLLASAYPAWRAIAVPPAQALRRL